MCDKRKRLHSSMTYEEYLDFCEQPPRKPSLRPLPDIPLSLPDFCLTTDTPTTFNLVPLHIIPEEDTVDVYPQPQIPKIKTKRIRFASENIQYTFMGFLEREIQRKKSKCTIDNEASR